MSFTVDVKEFGSEQEQRHVPQDVGQHEGRQGEADAALGTIRSAKWLLLGELRSGGGGQDRTGAG